jgi:hypothetical protein
MVRCGALGWLSGVSRAVIPGEAVDMTRFLLVPRIFVLTKIRRVCGATVGYGP